MWLKGFYIERAIAADPHLRRHGHRDRLILLLAYFLLYQGKEDIIQNQMSQFQTNS
jgi:hypothetical protein